MYRIVSCANNVCGWRSSENTYGKEEPRFCPKCDGPLNALVGDDPASISLYIDDLNVEKPAWLEQAVLDQAAAAPPKEK